MYSVGWSTFELRCVFMKKVIERIFDSGCDSNIMFKTSGKLEDDSGQWQDCYYL